MEKFRSFCRRVALPLLLVLGVWYFTQVLFAQRTQGAQAVQSGAAAVFDGENDDGAPPKDSDAGGQGAIEENKSYTARDDVALYLVTYGHLPDNFITKRAAEALGWDSRAGNLDEVAPGKSIGGDRYGNYEGGLPEAEGRKWRECDIGYDGGYRSAQRILYASDGLVYYTDDHYKTFVQMYDSNGERLS
ncbi:MAG: ribonuclease domain-containing protein [Ruthenibacterium sp.]